MEYQVSVVQVVEQPIAAARQRTTFGRVSQQIGELLGYPWQLIKEHPYLRTNGDNVAIYWDATGAGSIEVGVQVTSRFQETDKVVCSATPAGKVAMTSHFGPYNQLEAPHVAVRKWCQQNGYPLTLPYWEIYGDWDDDPSKLRTDVFYLLK